MKWSSWFTLFFVFFLAAVFSSLFFQTSSDLSWLWISSRLGNRQPLSSSYITSQNRWWDYPTAWWNHQTPWKNYRITSLSCTTLRRKLVKSCLKSQVFSEVAYSQDRRWFRQQDARHTENKAGRDGLSVGTISHFLAPAGILQVGFGFSIFNLMIYERVDPNYTSPQPKSLMK